MLQGNLGWALMQQNNYIDAEAAYRRALSIAPDNNKMCNLGICLMKQGRIAEAKETLRQVKPAVVDGPRGVDSHLKAFERAQEMLQDLESEMMNRGHDQFKQSQLFDAFLGSSSIWQPQPCKDPTIPPAAAGSSKLQDDFADENFDGNRINKRVGENRNPRPLLQKSTKFNLQPRNFLNIDARPFYSKHLIPDPKGPEFHDPLSSLKRTRSGNNVGLTVAKEAGAGKSEKPISAEPLEHKTRRRSLSSEGIDNKWIDLLPDNEALDEAIIAAVLAPVLEPSTTTMATTEQRSIHKKRLKVFQDITLSLSPRA